MSKGFNGYVVLYTTGFLLDIEQVSDQFSGGFLLKESVWNVEPLKNMIVNILMKRQGIILDDELMTNLDNDNMPISERELNEVLMALEIEGIVHVSRITKTKRRIELIRPGQEFLAIGED